MYPRKNPSIRMFFKEIMKNEKFLNYINHELIFDDILIVSD